MTNEYDYTDEVPPSEIDALIQRTHVLAGWAREVMEDCARLVRESQELAKAARALDQRSAGRIAPSNAFNATSSH